MAHGPRVPGRRKLKTYLRVLLPSLIALLIVFLTVVGYISYQTIFPEVSTEGNPVDYSLLQYQEVQTPYAGGSAWFLAGNSGAPAFFLCHDYGYNRMSTVNLANSLHDQGYNLFTLSLRGHTVGSSGPTSFGVLEGSDLAATIDSALAFNAVDRTRVGVWGVGLGAHAALRAALIDPRIRVLVLDSPYPSAHDFIDYQVTKRMGFQSKIFGGSVGLVSAALNLTTPLALYEQVTPASLEGRAVLYLVGQDSPSFVDWTKRLHDETPGEKQLLLLPRSRRSVLQTPEWNAYDERVVDFVRNYLPISVERPPSTEGPTRDRSNRVAARQAKNR